MGKLFGASLPFEALPPSKPSLGHFQMRQISDNFFLSSPHVTSYPACRWHVMMFMSFRIDLHLYGICDTVQTNHDTWHKQRDRVGFQLQVAVCKRHLSPTDREWLAMTSAFRLDGCCVTIILNNMGMHCDHIARNCDQLFVFWRRFAPARCASFTSS